MTDHDGGPSSGGPKPGDGYKIEIASVRAVLTPLEESVVAARKIKGDWKTLADHIGNSADFDVYDAAENMLSAWGFGMGRVAEHTDTVVETLRQVIAAYVMADLLRIKDFAPTADNIAKLPFGEHGLRAWQNGSRPKFDPPPQIYQEPWLDDHGSGGTYDVPTNPRKRYDGGWEVDGGSKGTIA
ncbi:MULTISPECIES: hypothetical protein [Streptomyces]|uniref:Uncharacterized protein n=1 Tax=Streptomyces lonegramiae TaxID=3075524 RepID=A0ABU2XXQ1_9ACTN|nr:hypothetical protein [Streptomyces sp. DSM 41529]MDT0550305.1 hypothetical protein [Streptomyces sp. DSM 41529]